MLRLLHASSSSVDRKLLAAATSVMVWQLLL
jgi:hypothetical protein